MAIGDNHGVILASDGSLWTWGESGFGWQVLGLGSNIRTQACLARIGVETNWVNIACGGSTTLALKSDGTIWAWGENLYGQLGDGTMARERATPVRSVPGADWKQVATAGAHSVALKRDGTLWSWGNNWAGQLGDGATNHSRVPVRVGSSTNWMRIWADHSRVPVRVGSSTNWMRIWANGIQNVGQQTDGSLWFWGWDYTRSQKGSSIPVPTRVSPDTNWVDVGMGDWMVFAIQSDGTLWAWGREAHLYTGAADTNADASPVRVGADRDWRACASFAQSCPVFMKHDGSLWVMESSGHRGVAPVTAIVTGLVTNNQLNCVANNTTLGGDPAFGIVKSLQITFQLGGTNRMLTFRENSTVSLGGSSQTLTIIRALYGDPRLFRHAAGLSSQASSEPPARLRRIALQKDVVAFCGGRHLLGAALTSEGEVWTWGEALGRHTRPIRPLQSLSRWLTRFGVSVHWGDPGPVTFKEPTLAGIAPPGLSENSLAHPKR
jgi:alpha-tubulin suppressor-like RCC1 family protein